MTKLIKYGDIKTNVPEIILSNIIQREFPELTGGESLELAHTKELWNIPKDILIHNGWDEFIRGQPQPYLNEEETIEFHDKNPNYMKNIINQEIIKKSMEELTILYS